MARRRRGVWVLKWVGTGVCVLIAGAFVVSLWCPFGYHRYSARPVGNFSVQKGYAMLLHDDVPEYEMSLRQERTTLRDGWASDRYLDRYEAAWLPGRFQALRYTVLVLPLWIPFLALLLPTLLLWYLDRRRAPPGHCRCGYNLTGLTSGRCPECGTAAPIAPPAAG